MYRHKILEGRNVLLGILFFFASTASCGGPGRCDLKGTWLIKKGSITPNYQRTAYEYLGNRVTFRRDQIELASGFFYSILSLDSGNWSLGRYPFVYYGKTEKYRIVNDSLQVYSKPYNEWNSFKIECVTSNELRLNTPSDTIVLVRLKEEKPREVCSIKMIRVHVYEQGLGLYGNNYKVTYSIDDKLTFQNLSESSRQSEEKKFEMGKGAFEKMCASFSQVEFQKLKDTYRTAESEAEIKEVEIEFLDGKLYKFHLENDEYPEELMLALIPALYGHQQYVYGDLPAIK